MRKLSINREEIKQIINDLKGFQEVLSKEHKLWKTTQIINKSELNIDMKMELLNLNLLNCEDEIQATDAIYDQVGGWVEAYEILASMVSSDDIIAMK